MMYSADIVPLLSLSQNIPKSLIKVLSNVPLFPRTLPKDCQMLLFSATYDDEVMKFAESVVPSPMVIRLRREEESLDNIKQYYVVCRSQEEKFQALSNMYGVVSIGQCIVFCQVSMVNTTKPYPLL